MDNTICYLNTDLDLTNCEDLTSLATAIEAAGAISLHVTKCDDGIWRATFETTTQHDNPETNIAAMLAIVESLPDPLRTLWGRCSLREFDIGYDCGDKPWGFNQGLSTELLGRIASVGASLRITLYPDRDKAGSEKTS